MKDIAIIGGGASGILAALFAAKKNNNVIVFEKQNKIGRKIRSTGNGRCNISNKYLEISNYHCSDARFLITVFSRFGLDETIKFFDSIGVPFVEESDGRLFPESGQASGVVDILNYELKNRRVELALNRMIENIIPVRNKIKITTAGKEEFFFDSVILSAGSCAHPQLGASNTGYELAASMGHKINKPFPAVVPLNIPLKSVYALQGIKWNCRIIAAVNEKAICESFGELLFTNYGISGPAALNISRSINENILKNQAPQIVIDFFPDMDEQMLSGKLDRLWIHKDKSLSFSLIGILKKRMPDILLKFAGMDPQKPVKDLTDSERREIIKTLKSLKLAPGKPRSFKDAVIAGGGVNINEINPATMESRIIKNLYITGELLDIDGNSGGYNLQFAWSSGAVAGMSQ